MRMTEIELDEVYTEFCYRLSEVGEGRMADALARMVLLMMHEVGDATRIHKAIDAALEGLPRTVKVERPVGLLQ